MLVLKGLVGLHRTVQLQLLQHYSLGHRLGLLWYWMASEKVVHWRRKWQPTPVLLPGKSHGQRSLVGCSWSCYKSDMAERLHFLFHRISRAKANRVLPREQAGHSKHPLSTTQEKTLHVDFTRWSALKSNWLYSLQQKMEKLDKVSINKTGNWLWLRS